MTTRLSVLALDMATKTGWSLRDSRGSLTSGVLNLSLRTGESGGMRLLRFKRWLREVLDGGVDLVAYERPISHGHGGSRVGALKVCANLEGVLLAELEGRCDYVSATPAAIKKHATGKGNANKALMVEAASKLWGVKPRDDNEADALCVLAWALNEVEGD